MRTLTLVAFGLTTYAAFSLIRSYRQVKRARAEAAQARAQLAKLSEQLNAITAQLAAAGKAGIFIADAYNDLMQKTLEAAGIEVPAEFDAVLPDDAHPMLKQLMECRRASATVHLSRVLPLIRPVTS